MAENDTTTVPVLAVQRGASKKASKRQTPEGKVLDAVIDWLQTVGAYVVRVVQAGKAGVPDVIACIDGQFIGIEVKAKGGRLSKLQQYNLDSIERANGYAVVVTGTEDITKLVDVLTQIRSN